MEPIKNPYAWLGASKKVEQPKQTELFPYDWTSYAAAPSEEKGKIGKLALQWLQDISGERIQSMADASSILERLNLEIVNSKNVSSKTASEKRADEIKTENLHRISNILLGKSGVGERLSTLGESYSELPNAFRKSVSIIKNHTKFGDLRDSPLYDDIDGSVFNDKMGYLEGKAYNHDLRKNYMNDAPGVFNFNNTISKAYNDMKANGYDIDNYNKVTHGSFQPIDMLTAYYNDKYDRKPGVDEARVKMRNAAIKQIQASLGLTGEINGNLSSKEDIEKAIEYDNQLLRAIQMSSASPEFEAERTEEIKQIKENREHLKEKLAAWKDEQSYDKPLLSDFNPMTTRAY